MSEDTTVSLNYDRERELTVLRLCGPRKIHIEAHIPMDCIANHSAEWFAVRYLEPMLAAYREELESRQLNRGRPDA